MPDKHLQTAEVGEVCPPRPLAVITAEINYYKSQTAQGLIEIGKRLKEAKEQVPHGEWRRWLEENVEFSQTTAWNLINIAEQFPNFQPVENLSYSKIVALLQVPAEEREEFIVQPHQVDGQEKSVAEMTKRELEKAIKARDEAIRQAELAHHRIETLEELNEQRVGDNAKLTRQLKEAGQRPVDVAVREPSSEELEKLRRQVEQDVENEYQHIVAQKERTISELQVRIQNAPSADPLPPEVVRGAKIAFEQALQAAYQAYSNIVLCMQVDRATEDCGYCIAVCNQVLDGLRNLQARAYELQCQNEGLELDDIDDF